jgi:PKD repeat protein
MKRILALIIVTLTIQLQAQNTNLYDHDNGEDNSRVGHHEVINNPYLPNTLKATSPAHREKGTTYFTNQVNVDSDGNNILNDAANEPSIAVDPTNPNRMAIGWRQFDNINSDFRQAGYGYTLDGGETWTFPGVIDPGVFRSDPVLDADAEGNFYYNSLTVENGDDYVCDVYIIDQGGVTWDNGTDARGGDKQWMVVDRTNGIGEGNIYSNWNVQFTSCNPGFFTRSTDGGAYYEDCVTVSGSPKWGNLTVGPEGEVYAPGTWSSGPVIAKSITAQDPNGDVTWDFAQTVYLGGDLSFSVGPNPGGLLGQAWAATDHSGGENHGNVYMLASVNPSGSDPLDVMFARSTDGGATWDTPVKVNDDQSSSYWQWFGTMSVAPNGRIDVVWLDTRDHPVGEQYYSSLYYAYSIDGGETFSVNERLSDSFDPHVGWPQQQKMGDYFHMYSDDEYAHLAWANTLNGEQDVYYTRIDPNIQIANFEAENRHPYTIETVEFTDLSTGDPEAWEWQFTPGTVTFAGGTNAYSQNPEVIFNIPGYYTVQLTSSFDDGESDIEIKTDYILATQMLVPEADFTAHITEPTTVEFVNFTDLSINEPDTWLWNFIPETVSYMGGTDENSQNPKVRFDEPGYYTVELTASNAAGGDTEIKIDYILASLPEPLADFEADNTMPVVDEPVYFTDLTDNTPNAWEWQFTPGTILYTEGTGENSQNPVVQFLEPGLYTVQLTAENESGSNTEIKYDYIHAIEILTVVVSATPESVCYGGFVQLDAEVGGGTGNYTFLWTSNPAGFTSTEQNPLVNPEVSTTYTLQVGDGGNIANDEIFVNVYPLPIIELGNWPEYLCNQQQPPVQLTATPEGGEFSGNSVSPSGVFSPEEATLGWNVISYTYEDENTCVGMAQDSIFVDDCLGVEGYENEISFNIYPNPTHDILYVEIDNLNITNAHISLLNMVGQIIYDKNVALQGSGFKTAINLKEQPKGMYILSVVVRDKKHYTKIFLSK